MMRIKYYCDCCKNEIEGYNLFINEIRPAGSLSSKLPHIGIKILSKDSDNLNPVPIEDVHYCKYCIIASVNTLDDRPKPD